MESSQEPVKITNIHFHTLCKRFSLICRCVFTVIILKKKPNRIKLFFKYDSLHTFSGNALSQQEF